ncbi:MAG TPA: Gmad2 immunoglobulin-like domain-containing protein [Dermatophilaceae bacterium]|jgi:Immunoglobulin-like domain of bacterial spore germination
MNPDPDDLERRLREVLHQEADRITPHERRTEILDMTRHKGQNIGSSRRWLVPAAAAAAVALIGAGIWGVSNTGGSQQARPAVTSTSTASPTGEPTSAPAVTPVPAPNPLPAGTGGVAGATTLLTLPAYFVGANSTTGNAFGLYREFIRTAVPVVATQAKKARAAVAAAMNASSLARDEHYLQPWSGTSVSIVTVTPSRITITLSGPGASGFTPAQTRLAVQQLVWTAQAAYGQGNIPVKFDIASGETKLFGTYPTSQKYNRPAPSLQYEVLAPIWITSPVRGQVFPAGASVTATGQSCAFEGTTQWQLKKSGTTVRSGTTTASSGCPTRGTWQVRLGVLGAGSYTFRMYEASMQDGTVIADTSKPFTVK